MSAAGTPSISQITRAGSGSENPATRSTGWAWPAIASMSWLTMPATRGRSASTRRAVNALATSLRSLVCPGGSIPLIEPAANISKPGRAWPGATASAREKRWSMIIWRTFS